MDQAGGTGQRGRGIDAGPNTRLARTGVLATELGSQSGRALAVVVDNELERACALAEELRRLYGGAGGVTVSATSDVAAAMAGATGLIHATPTGMDKLPGLPLRAALLRPELWLSEIVYFPRDTELLKAARAAGCRVVDGGTMAVGQAIGAFELFTGLAADAARIDAHFHRLTKERA